MRCATDRFLKHAIKTCQESPLGKNWDEFFQKQAIAPRGYQTWSMDNMSHFWPSDLGAQRRYKSPMGLCHIARFVPSIASLTLTAKCTTACCPYPYNQK
jgi:hypothetical protein